MANSKPYRDSRRAPMFDDEGPDLDAPFITNAHSETQYEDMRRLPTQTVLKRTDRDYEGQYEAIDQQPPMSARVRGQVLDSMAERSGSMTFAGQLDRSRGVGTLGDSGQVQRRGSGSAGDAPRGSGRGNPGMAMGACCDMPVSAAPNSRRRRS